MYAVAPEPWSLEFWAECQALAEAHFEEVDGGVEPKRPFDLDLDAMEMMQAAGCLKIVTARQSGRLVGYHTWNIMPDVESRGLLIAQMGAWFVAPGNPRAAFELFNVSCETLKSFGVQCIFPHHRLQGRGSDLGKFFTRQGAKPIQMTYSLWIGD